MELSNAQIAILFLHMLQSGNSERMEQAARTAGILRDLRRQLGHMAPGVTAMNAQLHKDVTELGLDFDGVRTLLEQFQRQTSTAAAGEPSNGSYKQSD